MVLLSGSNSGGKVMRVSFKPKKSIAKRALQTANANKKILTGDRHFISQSLPTVPVKTGATSSQISAIDQGSTINDRQGDHVRLTSVSYSGQLLGAGGGTSLVRIVVFKDKLNTGTVPGIAELFANSSTFAEGDHRLNTMAARQRFTILSDKTYKVGSVTLNDNFNIPIRFSKKLKTDCYFDGAADTSEGRNSVWITSASNLAASPPTITGTMKCTFLDA